MVLRTSTSLHYAVDNGYSPETTLGSSDTILGARMGTLGTHPPTSYPAVGKPAFVTWSPFPQQIGKLGGGEGRGRLQFPTQASLTSLQGCWTLLQPLQAQKEWSHVLSGAFGLNISLLPLSLASE